MSRHREELTKYRLCKKAIAAVLHCSLNFLYRDNNNRSKVVKRIEHFIDVVSVKFIHINNQRDRALTGRGSYKTGKELPIKPESGC